MPSQEPPTLILIHGAAHGDPAYSEKLRSELRQAGIPNESGTSPSNGGFPPSGQALYGDAAYWRAKLQRLVDAGKDVALLMHSLGGIVGTEAAQGLAKTERAAKGLPGGVVQMIFLGAFLADEGESASSFFGDGRLTAHAKHQKADNGVDILRLDSHAQHYYSDMAPEQQQYWAQYLQHYPLELVMQPITHVTWKDVPAAYILLELDEAIPVEAQKEMVSKAKERHGVEFKTFTLPSGHSPFLSMPSRLVGVVKSIYEQIEE